MRRLPLEILNPNAPQDVPWPATVVLILLGAAVVLMYIAFEVKKRK